jgi:hypothetical protein
VVIDGTVGHCNAAMRLLAGADVTQSDDLARTGSHLAPPVGFLKYFFTFRDMTRYVCRALGGNPRRPGKTGWHGPGAVKAGSGPPAARPPDRGGWGGK